jgi:hypothetical protein
MKHLIRNTAIAALSIAMLAHTEAYANAQSADQVLNITGNGCVGVLRRARHSDPTTANALVLQWKDAICVVPDQHDSQRLLKSKCRIGSLCEALGALEGCTVSGCIALSDLIAAWPVGPGAVRPLNNSR